MKNKGLIIFLIIIFVIIAVTLTIFMFNLIYGKNKIFKFSLYKKVSNELVIDKNYENEFKLINVNTDASDIYIKHSDNEKIKVLVYGDKDNTNINSNNNELTINSKGKVCIGFCFNRTISKVEIYLPSNYNHNIKVTNKFGDINIAEFLNSNLEINADCGDITIDEANDIKAINNYGDIKIKKVITANLEVKAGDITLRNVDNLIAHNKYGDIDIKSINNYLQIKADCGDITIDNLDLHKDSYIKNNYGDIEINSTNDLYIEAKTSLGDNKINKNIRDAETILKIENSCGDISVNN